MMKGNGEVLSTMKRLSEANFEDFRLRNRRNYLGCMSTIAVVVNQTIVIFTMQELSGENMVVAVGGLHFFVQFANISKNLYLNMLPIIMKCRL